MNWSEEAQRSTLKPDEPQLTSLSNQMGREQMSQKCCTMSLRSAGATLADDGQTQRAGSLPDDEIRIDKILDIRRQLQEGTYSIADRLDVVVERMIDELGEA